MGARFSAPAQTGSGAHPVSCKMGTESFPGVKSCRVVTLTPHPLLVPWSRKSRAIPLLPLWAVQPVQSLGGCTRVQFTYFSYLYIFQGATLLVGQGLIITESSQSYPFGNTRLSNNLLDEESPGHRDCLTTHSARGRHPWPRWGSNPKSHHLSSRRLTSYSTLPLGSAFLILTTKNISIS